MAIFKVKFDQPVPHLGPFLLAVLLFQKRTYKDYVLNVLSFISIN